MLQQFPLLRIETRCGSSVSYPFVCVFVVYAKLERPVKQEGQDSTAPGSCQGFRLIRRI
jgi:hypothetical protein